MPERRQEQQGAPRRWIARSGGAIARGSAGALLWRVGGWAGYGGATLVRGRDATG